MKLRFRFLTALFALLGLLTISVDGAWASTCAAGMEVESAASAVHPASQDMSCGAGMAALSTSGAELPGESHKGGSECPSMPMSAAGACGAALALPGYTSSLLEPSSPEALSFVPTDHAHELLLAAAFFRPPIA
jgi:hypothetical protein